MFYLFYSLLFYSVGLIIVSQKRFRKIIFYWLYLGITFFWGVSYHYAIDTPAYMDYYDYAPLLSQGISSFSSKFEIGFSVLAQLCKTISSQYLLFQLVVFGLVMLLIIEGLRKLFDDKTVVFIIPLLFFVFPQLLNTPRQGIATAVFIFALHFINDEKSWRYFICILIASLFHQSALLLVFVYLARYTDSLLSKNWLIFSVLIVCDLFYFMGVSVSNDISFVTEFLFGGFLDMGEKYATNYIYDEEILSSMGILKVLEVNITVVLFTLFCKDEKNISVFRSLLLLSVIIVLVFGGLFAHRLNYYFVIIYYICFVQGIRGLIHRLHIDSIVVPYALISVYMIWFYIFHCDLINYDFIFLPSFNGIY